MNDSMKNEKCKVRKMAESRVCAKIVIASASSCL